MDEQKVTIKFDGQYHRVDLTTFTNVLLDYSAVIRAAADQVGMQSPVKVCINATEPGSLDAIISVVVNNAGSLLDFLGDHETGLGAAIVAAGGLYKLKQKIAGKNEVKKEDVDNSTNEVTLNVDGDLLVVNGDVYGLYENHPEATAAIDHSFSTLAENPDVSAIRMKAGDEELFSAEREEFPGIASSPNYEGPEIRHRIVDAVLLVTKPYLAASKTRKWEFIYSGDKITACIHDESFLDSLDKYSFSVGTQMSVTLDITQELSEKFNAYLNKSFAVAEVKEVISSPKTERMF